MLVFCLFISFLSLSFFKTVRTPEKIAEVSAALLQNPNLSTRRAASGLGNSEATIQRIFKKDLRMHPYKLQLVQELLPRDHAKRMNFAEIQLERIERNLLLLENLFFSDEAHFHLSGGVNRQDFRYWSDENPHWYAEAPLHSPQVTVWMGIGHHNVVGPFFREGDNINGLRYLAMLRDQVLPVLRMQPNFAELIFMQDEAPLRNTSSGFSGCLVSWMVDGLGYHKSYGADTVATQVTEFDPNGLFLQGYLKSRIFTDQALPTIEFLERQIAEEAA